VHDRARAGDGVLAKLGGTVIGTSHKAPPDWAAFANGCCIRYFDYNDTYLSKEPAHPSDNFSAVLAIGEAVGATGKEIILAAAIAYEVQCRFCDQASIRARGWDHPTYGAFSTALACAKLMKLDREQTRHAINIAGVAGMGMRQAAWVSFRTGRVWPSRMRRAMASMRRCSRAAA
jgi:2-methylcitrate dehydratase